MIVKQSKLISGVYKITCVPTNKIYIGSSKDIRTRWSRHKRDLHTQKHSNTYLQLAYNKYGKDNFLWEIIEECCSAQVTEREQHYLDLLLPFGNKGFNLSVAAANPMLGRKHSEETKAKIRHARDLQTNALHRCIVVETKEVIRIRQRDIKKVWGIIDYSHFVHHPGHMSKKGLLSFVEKKFNGKLYKDEEAKQFIQDVLAKKEKNEENGAKRLGKYVGVKGSDGRFTKTLKIN